MLRSETRYDISITLRPDDCGAGTSPSSSSGCKLIDAAIKNYLKDDCVDACSEGDDGFVEVLVSTFTRPDQVMIDRMCSRAEKAVNWTLSQVAWDFREVRPLVF